MHCHCEHHGTRRIPFSNLCRLLRQVRRVIVVAIPAGKIQYVRLTRDTV